VEADGGERKRAPQPSSLPLQAGRRRREAIIAARDLSVTYYYCIFPNAQGVPATPPYTTFSFSFLSQASNTSPLPLGLPSLPLSAGWAPSTRTQR